MIHKHSICPFFSEKDADKTSSLEGVIVAYSPPGFGSTDLCCLGALGFQCLPLPSRGQTLILQLLRIGKGWPLQNQDKTRKTNPPRPILQALKLGPADADLYESMGHSLHSRGKLKEAESAFRKISSNLIPPDSGLYRSLEDTLLLAHGASRGSSLLSSCGRSV